MRILGIDPGSRVTGYGVIDSDGRQSQHVDSGCIRLGEGKLPSRLGSIFMEIDALIVQHAPVVLAIESVFMARNAASALVLGHARGAAITACVLRGLEIYEYAPRSIKQAVVGTGSADKAQIQHMMRLLLRVNQPLSVDAADALAVALCHAHTESTRAQLARRMR